jgi:tetratricopeptide (TPR) repeat protein
MNRLKWVMVLLTAAIGWLATGPAFADLAAKQFNEGNAAYRGARYGDAIAFYEKALKAGGRASRTYYNLGNAYLRVQKVGPAILSYERSLRLDAGNDDARQNLLFASTLLQDRVDSASFELRFLDQVNQLLGGISADWLAISLLLASCGLVAIVSLWLLGRFQRRLARVMFVLAGAVVFGAGAILGMQNWASDDGGAAIVLSEQADARFEPRNSARVSFVVHEGTKIWILRRDGSWAFVRLANGLRGWVPANAFELI